MSEIQDLPHLEFPLRTQEPLVAATTLIVRDLDVVGVGAVRRYQLEQLQKTHTFIIRTHALVIPDSVHGIYESELVDTLQWLRPLRVDIGAELNLQNELRATFARVFPRTSRHLGMMAKKVCDQYLAEMEWSSWLLQDHWRYFVGFLRQRFANNKVLLDLANWEWSQAWLEVQPFQNVAPEKNVVSEAPSLQIVSLNENNPVLGRDQGLYALIYQEKNHTVTERSLDMFEAALLDELREDRKYSRPQLIEMLQISTKGLPQLSAQEWEKRFLSLCDDGILLYEE